MKRWKMKDEGQVKRETKKDYDSESDKKIVDT